MLSRLFIRNVAVIEESAIDFTEGLNIFTGETGAGKSVIINALNGILGGRISKDIVRRGAEKATITALFTDLDDNVMKNVKELGFEVEEGEILLSREINDQGRSSCRINTQPATVSILRELGKLLITVHGQHDNEELLNEQKHIPFIDQFGGLQEDLKEYQSTFYEMQAVKKELDTLILDDAQKAKMQDILTYQIKEIESANLKDGEEENLLSEREVIRNAQKISTAMQLVHHNLSGDSESDGAMQLIWEAAQALRDMSQFLPDYLEKADLLESIYYDVEGVNDDVRGYLDDGETTTGSLDEIESRLDTIYRLKLKYGDSVSKILAYLDDCRSKLEQLDYSNERALQLRQRLEMIKERAQNLARQLSDKRKQAAARFCELVCQELSFLEMPFVRFQTEQKTTELTLNGIDFIRFMISTNPGEPPKPVDKIASGGELSRIMLAFKCVLAHRDQIKTLVFDEIDTGVSGKAAQKIGVKLKEVSKGRQVICITHLAQVAVFADNHLLIEKHLNAEHTYTKVHQLSGSQREEEIARIIGGASITDLTLQHARELIEQSHVL